MRLLLSFIAIAAFILGCCKIITRKAEIKIRFEGYAFNSTDSIEVTYFNSNLLFIDQKVYSLNPNQEMTINVSQENSPYSMVTITNTRLALRDTLKNFYITTEKTSKLCTGIEQTKVSFNTQNKKYEASALIELTLKR